MVTLPDPLEFEWDTGNQEKNLYKHNVSIQECESVFFDTQVFVFDDIVHSQNELRYYALGKTSEGRLLSIAFTIRTHTVRVISARDMSKKERRYYEEKIGVTKV